MAPTVGRIVHYRVAEHDTEPIIHNAIKPGDVLPAVVVRVWGEQCINARIVCDGPADGWKTSIVKGDLPGQWSWPPRADAPA